MRKDNGKDFAELAKNNSDDPGSKDQGGELGWIKHGVTVPEFDQTAFAQQPGQISGLVRTRFGYHIIQTEAKEEAHTKPLDEVRASIVDTLTKQTETQAEQSLAAQIAADAQKTSLAQAAQAHHVPVMTSDYVASNATLPGMSDSSKLLSAAFAAKAGGPVQVASTGDNSFGVFQVIDAKAAHTPTFEEYKSHVLDDFRDQQVTSLLARKTNEMADRAHAEHDLAKAAKEAGATIKTSDLVGRDAQVPDVGSLATAAPSLFDLNVGQVSNAINNGTTGVVAQITDKQQPTEAELQKNFDSMRDNLLNQRREQAFSVFASSLFERYQKAQRILVNRKLQQPSPLSGS